MFEQNDLKFFAQCPPGLEPALAGELRSLGAGGLEPGHGGVAFTGDRALAARANLMLRTATRVLLRLDRFPAAHLNELESRARRVPWERYLTKDQPFQLRVSCHASRIYHTGAAEERVARALAAATGGRADKTAGAALVLVRIERDGCELSLDTSGAPLHQRGFKAEVGAAPLRETLAAGVLLLAGYDGSQPLLDPMCGSGTFALEAGLLALGRAPGLDRRFALEDVPGFGPGLFAEERARLRALERPAPPAPILAADADAGAVGKARRNLARAGLEGLVRLERRRLEDQRLGPGPGLVVVNPPYGGRLGRGDDLEALHARLGALVGGTGWRLALVTEQERLAHATGLVFQAVRGPLHHGGRKVRLYLTA
ncbi:MAG TPA: THUMP domain-containing protein [Myxococcota bacterium]|nr:THUMP domain-containing protein [Myxococcota bacterium]HRY92764.1 THUMP domain-containing protein [Myxococcota bacterium]